MARERLEMPSSSFGVPGLDVVLGGKLLPGETILVSGAPGLGKTVLANQLAFHHVASGGRAVFVTLLSEIHERMFEHMRSFAFFAHEVVGDRLLYVSGHHALETGGLSGLLELLEKTVRQHGAAFLVIEDVSSAPAYATEALGFKRFLHRFQVFAHAMECTTLLISAHEQGTDRPEEALVDTAIELRHVLAGPRGTRDLWVKKARGRRHLDGRHFYAIGADGVVVYPRTEAWRGATRARAVAAPPRVPTGIAGLDAMLQGGCRQVRATSSSVHRAAARHSSDCTS